MRILVVGSGGREHALAWKLAREATVFCAPGNPGTAKVGQNLPILATEFEALVDACRVHAIDLVVVGPEDPLIAGLADHLRANGVLVYGAGASGARLEGDKAFSKAMMRKAGVPTAEFAAFTDPEPAKAFARERAATGRRVVIKATGAAVGKGVIVADDLAQADAAIDAALVERRFGDAGSTIVVEDRLDGQEFSLLTVVGDDNYVSLPIAQDYKRAYDGDQGPNTGGMGSYSPVAWASDDLVRRAEERVVAPLVAQLRADGIQFRGTLFSGLMVVEDEPFCLEYNVRFGDPETQTVMRRLGAGLARALFASASGALVPPVEVLDHAAVTVVVAARDYPASGSRGAPIDVPTDADDVVVFHAGTSIVGDRLITNGGRVLGVSAIGETTSIARERAYATAAAVRFEGARYRTDVAS